MDWWHHCWVCFNPDGLCLSTLAVIAYRVQVLHALKSSSGLARTQQGPGSLRQAVRQRGNITPLDPPVPQTQWLYRMNKSHYQGPGISNTASLLLWQMSASQFIFLSLFLPRILFFIPLALACSPTVLTLFITWLWHFWIKLNTHTDWTLLVRAGKHFGFQ